jgi:hypothetical protein
VNAYRVLLPHPLEPRLLMMQGQGEPRLPEWEDATEQPWHVTEHVTRAVAARFGMETTVLRCARRSIDPATARELRVYELDNHSAPHDMVPASTWMGRGEMDLLKVQDAASRELITEWFSREAGELPLAGPPWTRRGWYVEALAWTIARLREMGVAARGTPDQLRTSERSFLMRLRTDRGIFYFKAAPSMYGHEPQLMQWLAARYPQNLPEIVAVDASRGWFVQREADGAALPLDEVREEEEWYRAARRLADIQVDSVAHVAELRKLGCPYRGLDVLARRIPRLCADTSAMMPGEPGGLTHREIERVASLAPTLLALCEELASYGIPDALEHGDLWPSNVLSTLAGPIYLDWSDSSVSHPFFSLTQLMDRAAGLLPASSRESRRRLRDSYVAPWFGFAAEASLARAFELARLLAPVHLAATAHAELAPSAGNRWEIAPAVPAYLRMALRVLADDAAVPL